ncbi:MAG: DNA-binding domain-containing protein [Pseudomonadota bacterium]|nr:DNA-binding domain-containing protein [Pseudomonadota bacterium]
MNTLEQLQQDFYEAVFEKAEPNFISSTYAEERLNIYRQTIFDNLRNVLLIIFPGVWALLGDECANGVAFAFCRHKIYLPATGCLDDWGAQFPNFLAGLTELKELVYLRDYADYEYLKHQSYRAESVAAITGAHLQAITEEQIETVKLSLLPSVFCFVSGFPLDEIDAVINNPDLDAINLTTKRTCALIARPENTVTTFWVPADLECFVRALQNNLNLAESLQLTLGEFSEFNIQQAIEFLLHNHLIARIHS